MAIRVKYLDRFWSLRKDGTFATVIKVDIHKAFMLNALFWDLTNIPEAFQQFRDLLCEEGIFFCGEVLEVSTLRHHKELVSMLIVVTSLHIQEKQK